jgi:hypothetical protein
VLDLLLLLGVSTYLFGDKVLVFVKMGDGGSVVNVRTETKTTTPGSINCTSERRDVG